MTCVKYSRVTLNRLTLVIPAYANRLYSDKNSGEDKCKKKAVKCLGDDPVQVSKCKKEPGDVCQQGTLRVPPLPAECKTDVTSFPVYDKTCSRPYRNPCLPDITKTCKCDMHPYPCVSPCERKPKICLGEPDCAYERHFDWGLWLTKLFIGVGIIVGGLVFYKMYGIEKKVETIHIKRDRRFNRPMEVVKNPSTSMDIPDTIEYLLIGGGTAAYAAQKAIRSLVKDAKVLIISDGPPYIPSMRPPLSTWLWKERNRDKALDLEFMGWDGKDRSILFEPSNYYTPVQQLNDSTKGGVGVAQGWSVKKLNPKNQTVVLEDGKKIRYEKCLLATGGRPKVVSPFDDADAKLLEKVTFYRNSFDFQELEELIQEGLKCIAIVGGGFLGTELAANIKERTKHDNIKVINLVKDIGNLSKILPTYLAKRISQVLSSRGVHVMTDVSLEDVAREGNSIKLYLNGEKCVVADHVVVATGIEPNVDLSKDSCLELDSQHGGFLVNAEMQSCKGIYAAGDCASFYDCTLGRRRVEHHDFALATGKIAGENMTGQNNELTLQPSFWCHLPPDYEIEATGEIDTNYDTVAVFPKSHKTEESANSNENHNEKETTKGNHRGNDKGYDVVKGDDEDLEETLANQTFDKGVIFYLDDSQIIKGILTLNLPGKISVAKVLVNQKKTYDDIDELTKIFELHASSGKNNKKRKK